MAESAVADQDRAPDSGLAPAVEILGVHRSYDAKKALDNVTFSVPRNSVFGLLGPNGAGKTTLFSIIAGFLNADEGNVRVLGIDNRRTHELIGRLSILPQDAHFQRNIPLMEQLIYYRRLDGLSRREAVEEVREVLARVGLGEYAERGVQVLSHGMKKRLGVAQAFLGEPDVVLLDEPTAGLDPHNARQIRELVQGLSQSGTVVISSHNLREIQELCDHVAILDRGKLVVTGPTHEITHGGASLHLKLPRAVTTEQLQLLKIVDGVEWIEQESPGDISVGFTSDTDDTDEAVARLLRTLLEVKLVPRTMSRGGSLEDRFLALTERSDED